MTTSPMKQRGVALVTGLLLLAVLTIVAVAAMQGTGLELKMATNTAVHAQAFEASEGLRLVAGRLLDEHTFWRGWPTTMTGGVIPSGDFEVAIPSGLTVDSNDGDEEDAADDLYINNPEGADAIQTAAEWGDLDVDMELCVYNTDPDTGCTDAADTRAQVAVYKTGVRQGVGTGSAQAAGYEGLGVAASAGGAHLFYELRSRGTAASNAESLTVAEYRHIIRN